MKPLQGLKIASICRVIPKEKPDAPEFIEIGPWDGDYITLVSILIEYNPEFRVRITKKRIIVKEYTDESNTKFKFYKCFALEQKIIIPYYERRPYCPIPGDAFEEPELRSGDDLLDGDSETHHQ